MTYLDVYITTPNQVVGLEGDAPKEDDEPDGWTGRPVHWFPPWGPGPPNAFSAVRDGVQSGRWPGVQVDWGSWAARMTRDEIMRFIRPAPTR